MFLVVPDGYILPGTIVVDGGTTLRMASLGDAFAGGTSRGWGVQPGEDRTSRRVMLPPGRLSGQTRGCALPELLGVSQSEDSKKVMEDIESSAVGFVGRKGRAD